ncbi:unnamed protein product [Amoebophrya sp. A120]|nr:unnamed protein product [Amoebophrya sp. A120]|eukprot:GSA120T00007309001.1
MSDWLRGILVCRFDLNVGQVCEYDVLEEVQRQQELRSYADEHENEFHHAPLSEEEKKLCALMAFPDSNSLPASCNVSPSPDNFNGGIGPLEGKNPSNKLLSRNSRSSSSRTSANEKEACFSFRFRRKPAGGGGGPRTARNLAILTSQQGQDVGGTGGTTTSSISHVGVGAKTSTASQLLLGRASTTGETAAAGRSTSSPPYPYLTAASFFKQQSDPTNPRGYSQKAIVVITDHDWRVFGCLVKQIALVLGPLYFENGEKVLQTAWSLINSEWPKLRDLLMVDTGGEVEGAGKNGKDKDDHFPCLKNVEPAASARSTRSPNLHPVMAGSSPVDSSPASSSPKVSAEQGPGATENGTTRPARARAPGNKDIKGQPAEDRLEDEDPQADTITSDSEEQKAEADEPSSSKLTVELKLFSATLRIDLTPTELHTECQTVTVEDSGGSFLNARRSTSKGGSSLIIPPSPSALLSKITNFFSHEQMPPSSSRQAGNTGLAHKLQSSQQGHGHDQEHLVPAQAPPQEAQACNHDLITHHQRTRTASKTSNSSTSASPVSSPTSPKTSGSRDGRNAAIITAPTSAAATTKMTTRDGEVEVVSATTPATSGEIQKQRSSAISVKSDDSGGGRTTNQASLLPLHPSMLTSAGPPLRRSGSKSPASNVSTSAAPAPSLHHREQKTKTKLTVHSTFDASTLQFRDWIFPKWAILQAKTGAAVGLGTSCGSSTSSFNPASRGQTNGMNFTKNAGGVGGSAKHPHNNATSSTSSAYGGAAGSTSASRNVVPTNSASSGINIMGDFFRTFVAANTSSPASVQKTSVIHDEELLVVSQGNNTKNEAAAGMKTKIKKLSPGRTSCETGEDGRNSIGTDYKDTTCTSGTTNNTAPDADVESINRGGGVVAGKTLSAPQGKAGGSSIRTNGKQMKTDGAVVVSTVVQPQPRPRIISPRKHSVQYGVQRKNNSTRELALHLTQTQHENAATNLWTKLAEFGPEALWTLWQLCITGEPIVIFSQDSTIVDDAVGAFLQLIAPLVITETSGAEGSGSATSSGSRKTGLQYVPHLTVYDPDYREIRNQVVVAAAPAATSNNFHGATSNGGTSTSIMTYNGETRHQPGVVLATSTSSSTSPPVLPSSCNLVLGCSNPAIFVDLTRTKSQLSSLVLQHSAKYVVATNSSGSSASCRSSSSGGASSSNEDLPGLNLAAGGEGPAPAVVVPSGRENQPAPSCSRTSSFSSSSTSGSSNTTSTTTVKNATDYVAAAGGQQKAETAAAANTPATATSSPDDAKQQRLLRLARAQSAAAGAAGSAMEVVVGDKSSNHISYRPGAVPEKNGENAGRAFSSFLQKSATVGAASSTGRSATGSSALRPNFSFSNPTSNSSTSPSATFVNNTTTLPFSPSTPQNLIKPGNFGQAKLICSDTSYLYTEHSGIVPVDEELLSRLLPPTSHSAIMINNFLLCQYFYELTCVFLKPFLPYLVSNVGVLSSHAGGGGGRSLSRREVGESSKKSENSRPGVDHLDEGEDAVRRTRTGSAAAASSTSPPLEQVNTTSKGDDPRANRKMKMKSNLEVETTSLQKMSGEQADDFQPTMEANEFRSSSRGQMNLIVGGRGSRTSLQILEQQAENLHLSLSNYDYHSQCRSKINPTSTVSPSTTTSTSARSGGASGVAPTTSSKKVHVTLLPAFVSQEFLNGLQPEGVFQQLPIQKVRKLYTKFIKSPHFEPWFRKQRDQVVAESLALHKKRKEQAGMNKQGLK